MKALIREKIKEYPLWLWAAGLTAGFINGLLGAGGGVVTVFALSYYFGRQKADRSRDVFALTVASVLPVSVISAFSYSSRLGADYSGSMKYMIPGMLGGLVGALITDRISTDKLKLIFALLTVTAGINMIIR